MEKIKVDCVSMEVEKRIKKQVEEWIKQDLEEAKKRGLGKRERNLIYKWARRFNISEKIIKKEVK